MENVRKHRDIKLVTADKGRNQLVSKSNYHTTKWFSENLLAIEIKKTKLKMNKPVYPGFSILEISKTLMYEDIANEDIANDAEKRFDTSNYECDRPLPEGKNKKVIGLMKDELGGKIMTKFVALGSYSYLVDDESVTKKAKGTKKRPQQRFKSEAHDVYTEKVNKIELSSNDDKRLLDYDGITACPYETSAGKVCKTEILRKVVKI